MSAVFLMAIVNTCVLTLLEDIIVLVLMDFYYNLTNAIALVSLLLYFFRMH